MSAKILVVDDDPSVRTALVRMLARDGYELVTAVNGIEALQRVAIDQPDLILLDIYMSPGPDGYEVCRRLKADDRTALIPITFLTAHSDGEQRHKATSAGADDYLTKPVNQDLLRARVRTQLRVKRLTDQLERTESVIFMLARAVEAKDHYTGMHLQRLADYSSQLAMAAGLETDDITAIRYGGILHDIGKIRINEEVLTRPGPLTPEEFAQFKLHPEYGAEMIAHMRFARKVVPIVLGHHEQWDGSGYPHGRRAHHIPIGARIVAIVDSFDAMTTDRPYRRALSQEEALRRLRAGSGRQWDPELVALFCTLVEHDQLKLSMPPLYPDELEKYLL